MRLSSAYLKPNLVVRPCLSDYGKIMASSIIHNNTYIVNIITSYRTSNNSLMALSVLRHGAIQILFPTDEDYVTESE